jgi:hypothetical protein
MTRPAQRTQPRPDALGITLPLLLAMALLVPLAMLFAQSRQATEKERGSAVTELHGVEYLGALEQVTMALTDTQSAVVAGRSASREALKRAIDNTTAVDARVGDELRTRERWAGLRAKIDTLPQRGVAGADEAYAAYSEASDLVLALYGKVRESSGLVRDPQGDSYHLQDALAEELPEALVAAGRLADLAGLASTRGSADRVRTGTELATARAAVLSPAGDLVNDLLAAVDSTKSGNLSGKLLSRLDGYQRAIEALAASTRAGTSGPEAGISVDAARIAAARVSAESAARELSAVISTELDALIKTRIDGLDRQRRLTLGVAAVAVLLVLALATVAILGPHRRAPRQPQAHPPRPGGRPSGPGETRHPSSDAAVGPGRRDTLADSPGHIPVGLNARPTQSGVTMRDNEPAQWGRSDAAR